MPKKRKPLTEEQRKAAVERLRLAREAKAAKNAGMMPSPTHAPKTEDVPSAHGLSAEQNVGDSENQADPSPADTSVEEGAKANDTEVLLAQIRELQKSHPELFQAPPVQAGAQVTQAGVVGTTVKYNDPKSYPDPRDRLFREPRLKIQGFNRDWWDLEWNVTAFRYQTKDGLWFSEPKFDLQLIRIVADEEGMPSSKRYVLHKVTLFEDPDAAMQIANQYGFEVPANLERSFLDEMRYLRIRDWVLESFYPPKPTQARMNKTETVIGNRLVEVFEANSATPVEVPFNSLNKKL